MTINIRPAAGLLRDAAPALLIAFAALLYAVKCNFAELDGANAPVSLLLVVPGLVSVVTARPGEHPYASSVLFVIRLIAVLPLPLGLVAAFVLLTKGSEAVLTVCAALALAGGLLLLLGRAIDWFTIRPRLAEWVNDDLTRVG